MVRLSGEDDSDEHTLNSTLLMQETTPHRRSVLSTQLLSEIFDSLPLEPSQSPDAVRTAPISLLPELIRKFEARRQISLLSPDELAQLVEFASMSPDMRVGVDDLMTVFQSLAALPTPPTPVPQSELVQAPRTPTEITRPLPQIETTPGGAQERGTDKMLTPDAAKLSDGSPPPRASRARASSSLSTASTESTQSVSMPPVSGYAIPTPSTTPSTTPSRLDRGLDRSSSMSSNSGSKRRSFLASLVSGSNNRAIAVETAAAIEASEKEGLGGSTKAWGGGKYLGISLDGPLGEGWDGVKEADAIRAATKGTGTREKDLIDALVDKTWPQIRAIDQAYRNKYGKSLLELIASEKLIRGHFEMALRGVIMGPLNFDVELLKKALSSDITKEKNDMLLIELLVASPPESLALLRLAFSRRVTSSKSTPAKYKSLDEAVLAACSGNANLQLRKAWEVVLKGEWVDAQSDSTEGKNTKLLQEDVDQLKVALRKGGNTTLVTNIILARSPDHVHLINVDFLKATGKTLTKAIKDIFTGTLAKLLLFAVQNVHEYEDGLGVWRDAELLEQAMEGIGTRSETLGYRIVRAHWDRPRFLRIEKAYRLKYRKYLVDRVNGEVSGSFGQLMKGLMLAVNIPPPVMSSQDMERLHSTRSRHSSFSSMRSVQVEEDVPGEDEVEKTELEGEGQLSKPPSPLSAGATTLALEEGDSTTPVAMVFPSAAVETAILETNRPATPSDGKAPPSHKPSSSLSFRQRSSPLDTSFSHKPPSSSGGSATHSPSPSLSSLRHSRPTAPGRIRRTSGEHGAPRIGAISPSGSSESHSPSATRSPTPSGSREQTKSPTEQFAIDRRPSSRSTSGSSSNATTPSSPVEANQGSASPPTGTIDFTTSYHAPPISPVGDVGPSSSRPSSPTIDALALSALAPAATQEYFIPSPASSPEKETGSEFVRRQVSSSSTASTTGSGSASGGDSRPPTTYFGTGMSGPESFRPESISGAMFGFSGRPGSTGSGVGVGDQQFQMMLRTTQDLSRKLKETELRLTQSVAAFEQDSADLEMRLEEARAELQIKRREEKELRMTEKQHLSQISALETEISKLAKSLEKSRESYEVMKRSFTEQCSETEKLRNLVAETRRENRAAEDIASGHLLQLHQFEGERDLLQSAINKLEADLVVAGRAQDLLNEQKQENLILKETIDRLRFDMDELRAAGRKSLYVDSSTDSSAGGSVSRSLGGELARRLAETELEDAVGDDDEETESEAEEEDIVVTTHRRIRKRAKTATASQPVVTHERTVTIVLDANIQTDPIDATDQVVETISAPIIPSKTPQEVQDELAQGLGVEWSKLVALVEGDKEKEKEAKAKEEAEKRSKLSPAFSVVNESRRAGRWAARLSSRLPPFAAAAQAPAYFINVFPDSARPYVSQVLESTTSFVLYSAVVYLSGFISGSIVAPANHYHHLAPFHVMVGPSDRAAFHQLNTFSTAWGQGISDHTGVNGGFSDSFSFWLHHIIFGGVAAYRRIPT